ncbi:MAG: beta strand repeat-containing protein [Gemmatimonadales bacterium]
MIRRNARAAVPARPVALGAALCVGLVLSCTSSTEPDIALVLALAEVDFTGVQGGADPTPRSVSLTATEGGQLGGLAASASYGTGASGWLSATLSKASTPATLTIAPSLTGLGPGVYEAEVHVTGGDGGQAAVALDVTLTVEEPPPTLALPTSPIAFTAERGGVDPDSQVVAVQNAGGGTLENISLGGVVYGSGQPAGWLDTRRLSGSSGTPTITLRPSVGSLAAGAYDAQVRVVATNAVNAPASFPVSFTITEPVAAKLAMVVEPAGAVAGAAFTTQPSVRVAGSNGQPVSVSGIGITAHVESGGGTLGGTASATTDANGIATFVDLELTATGLHRLRFAATDLAPVLSTEILVAGAALIELSDTVIDFDAVAGGPSPTARSVAVTNGGTGPLGGLVVEGIAYGSGQPTGWLTASPSDDTAPITIDLVATVGSLAPGTYSATLTLHSPDASNGPRTVAVTFLVRAPAVISVSPTPAGFVGSVGGGVSPPSRTVTITNGGTGALEGLSLGTVSYGPGVGGWLAVSALSSQAAPSTVVLTAVPAALSGAAAGTYTASIPVTSSGPGVVPASIDVELTLSAADQICLNAADVPFAPAIAGSSPAPVSLSASGCSGASLPVSIGLITYADGQPGGWLGVAPGVGSELVFTASTAALLPGTYTASVRLSSAQAGVLPIDVAVSAEVLPAVQTIAAAPPTVAFSALTGGSDPTPEPVTVSNGSGLGVLGGLSIGGITYGSGAADWLQAALSGASAPATMTLTASGAGLAGGVYGAEVQIVSTIPGVPPLAYPVTFTLQDPPSIALSPPTLTFSATEFRPDPPAQQVGVGNGGDLPLTGLSVGSITGPGGQPAPWLSASLDGTSAPATLDVAAASSSLAPGTYTGTVRIVSSLSGVQAADLQVTLTVAVGAPPSIVLSGSTVPFTVPQGGPDPAASLVQVTNGGDVPLTGLQVGAMAYGPGPSGWATALLLGTSAPAQVAIDASAENLAPGTYTATVSVGSTLAGVAARTLTVTLTVGAAQPPPTLAAGAPAANFSAISGGGSPAPVLLPVTASGGAAAGLAASVTYDQPGPAWLAAAIAGATPTTLTLQPSVTGLADGIYTATVRISSTTPGVSPTFVEVSLVIGPAAPPAVMTLSPAAVTAVTAQSTSAGSQYVTITNTGGGALGGLSVGAATDMGGQPVAWVTPSISSSSAPATVTLTFATSALAIGSYSATFPVLSSQPGIATQTVSVGLTVTGSINPPAGAIGASPTSVSFAAHVSGTTSPQRSVLLTNTGARSVYALQTSITYGPEGTGWLFADVSGPTLPSTLTLYPYSLGLTAGTYTATVEVRGTTQTGPSFFEIQVTRTITVTMVVREDDIDVTPSFVTFVPYPLLGSTTPVDLLEPIEITSTGGPTVPGLTVTDLGPAPWLTTTLSSTSTPALLYLRADPTGLGLGRQLTTLAIGFEGNSEAEYVDVELRVFGFVLDSSQVSLTAQDGTIPQSTVSIEYGGNEPVIGDVVYGVGQPAGWLEAEMTCPFSGCPSNRVYLTVRAITSDLPAGTHQATVRIDGQNPGVPSQTLAVTLTVLPPTIPVLAVSTHAVTFTGPAVGVSPLPVAIDVVNTGAGSITDLLVGQLPLPAWLSASLDRTTTPARLTLTPSVVGLAPGYYFATLFVSGVENLNVPTIDVVMTVPSVPLLTLSTSLLEFNAGGGGANPASRTTLITAAASGVGPAAPLTGLRVDSVTYQVGQPTGWLTWALSSTTAPATLRVQPFTGSLPENDYVARIWLSSPVAGNNPRSVEVRFEVGPPSLTLSSSAVSLMAYSPQAPFADVDVTSGGAIVSDLTLGAPVYQSGSAWLTAQLVGGSTTPTRIRLTAAMGSLAPGTYQATVDVLSAMSANSPRTITVTFDVRPGIGVAQSFVSFPSFAPPPGTSTLTQTVSITNTGAGTLTGLSATVSSGAPWLQATLSQTTAPATLTLSVVPGALSVATRNATVTIASAVAGNTPRTISVSYSISTSFRQDVVPLISAPSSAGGRCAGCHGAGGSKPNLTAGADTTALHGRLVGPAVTPCGGTGRTYAIPGRPELSELLSLVGPNPNPYPCGQPFMPIGETYQGTFAQQQLRTALDAWIREGAPNN